MKRGAAGSRQHPVHRRKLDSPFPSFLFFLPIHRLRLFGLPGVLWTLYARSDTASNVSGLTQLRWLCRRVRLQKVSM